MLDDRQLSAYLDRIGHAGSREPTLALLRGLVAAHARTIPFENIDVLLGREIRLDADTLIDKLVRRGRGGYCFEHNLLLAGALQRLGFAVEMLAGRVLWGLSGDRLGPRVHLLLRVATPEGDFLADVGFGRLTLTAPLRLAIGPEQPTPHDTHRLVEAEDEIELHARLDGGWARLYRFGLVPQLPADYEMANWFTATSPASVFTSHLMMARGDPERRFALFDRQFTVRRRNGEAERRTLAEAGELGEVLGRHFGLELPGADVIAVWERISRSS